MNICYFVKETHQYFVNGMEYTSVSELWKKYFGKFDSLEISLKKAYKELDEKVYEDCKKILSYNDPGFLDLLRKTSKIKTKIIEEKASSYRNQWIDKAQKGTDFHKVKEEEDYKKGYRINPFDNKKYKIIKWDIEPNYENQSYPGKLINIPNGYVSEHLIKSDEYKVAGQMDQNFIETINGKRYVDIDDWKTDAEILLKPSYINPKYKSPYFKYPVDHIYETNYWKYVLKISTYAKILEMEGFIVRNLAFTHVLLDENSNVISKQRYKLPYKKEEVEFILEEKL